MNNPSNRLVPPIQSLPPLLRETVYEVERITKASLGMILTCLLGALSLSIQGAIDVYQPSKRITPVLLFLLLLAESGERKSSVSGLILKPFYDQEATWQDEYQLAMGEYKTELLAWNTEQKVILSQIERLAKKGETTEPGKEKLREHSIKEPKEPKLKKTIYEDATPEAILHGLRENYQSAGIISDEAISVFNGRALHNPGGLNKLWDGQQLAVDRRGAANFVVKDGRLSILLMAQNKVLQQFQERRNDLMRDIGLFARFLVAQPQSTQGTRFIDNQEYELVYLPRFHARLMEIIEETVSINLTTKKPLRKVLKFTPEAESRWMVSYNSIEYQMQDSGVLFPVKDYASKLADNQARLAALLHYFSEGDSDISIDAVNAAIDLGAWFTNEFLSIFSPPPPVAEDVRDAVELGQWLRNCYCQGYRYMRKNHIRQNGPSQLRKKNRLDPALNVLMAQRHISFLTNGHTSFIDLNPGLPPDLAAWQAAVNPNRATNPVF